MAGRARRRRLATALVALALLVAGCSSVLPGDGTRTPYDVPDRTGVATTPAGTPTGDGATGDPTATTATRPGSDPADVGADDGPYPELEVEELAPGLTPEAVTDPGRLAAAHRRVLDGRSFRTSYRRVEARPGGNRTVAVRASLSADRRRYRVHRTVLRPGDGPRARTVTAYWSGDGRTLRMLTFGDTRTFGRLPANRSLPELPEVDDPVRSSLVRWAFATTVLVGVEDVPSAVAPAQYRVTATGDRVRSLAPDGTPVRNASLVAVVDSRGVVRRLRLSYDRPGENGTVDVAVSLSVDGIGSTSPTPPAWTDDATESFNGTDPIGGTRTRPFFGSRPGT